MWLYFIFKALHLIGAVAWFAGLFYLVRMFVYHTEAYDKAEPAGSILRQQFQLMESRVYKIICNPAMMLTFAFGISLLVNHPAYLKSPWIHVKLTLVILLLVYHLYCKKIMNQLAKGRTQFSSFQFRLFNELPTLFLVAIIFLAVFKDNLSLLKLFGGLFIFGLALFAIAKGYKAKLAK